VSPVCPAVQPPRALARPNIDTRLKARFNPFLSPGNLMSLRRISIVVVLLFASLGVALMSSLSPLSQDIPAADSSVFLVIAQGMLDGKTPYIDFFDHKGPLLYFINCLGLSLGGKGGLGVWAIQTLLLFVSAVFAWKTARMFTGRYLSLFSVLLPFLILASIYTQGNFPEEYVLPLIFISLYLYTGYFSGKFELNRPKSALIGACFGASLMLKPNMFSLWSAFSIAFLAWEFRRKNYNSLLRHTIFFAIGTAATVLPCIIYLLAIGAFSAYIEQCFLFNFAYANNVLLPEAPRHGGYSNGWMRHAADFIYVLKSNFLWVVLGFIALRIIKEPNAKKRIYCGALLLAVFTGILLFLKSPILGPRNFMVLIPFFVPATAFAFAFLQKKEMSENKFLKASTASFFKISIPLFLLLGVFLTSHTFDAFRELTSSEPEKQNALSKIKLNRILKTVSGKLDRNDTITVFGNNCSLYLYSGIPSASKYIYQYPPALMSEKIVREYQADILHKKPKIIFVAWPCLSPNPGDSGSLARLHELFPEIGKLLDTEYKQIHLEKGFTFVFERQTKETR
jgi:hypothetical protein